jgi:hypothetical protein
MIIIILIILIKLFIWIVYGIPQSVYELEWGGLIPDKAKHLSSTSRVAVVPTQSVDRGSSISGNCSKYSNYFIWVENNLYPFSDSLFIEHSSFLRCFAVSLAG